MSGGERRLVSFLRGILSGARIILLDEPSNDLDYKMVQKVVEIILEFSSQKLFIIVTHDRRFDAIKDGTLYIINNDIIYEEHNAGKARLISDTLHKSNHSHKKNNPVNIQKLINHIWSNYAVSALIIAVLSIAALYMTKFALYDETTEPPELPRNQINLFSEISQMGGYIWTKGSYPVTAVKKLLEGNLWLISSERLKPPVSDPSEDDYNVNIDSSDAFDVFPLEFFVPGERRHIFTLYTYIEDGLGLDPFFNSLDIDSFLMVPHYPAAEHIHKFDKELFDDTIRYIQETNTTAIPVYVSIILRDGYSLTDFLNSSTLEDLAASNVIYISRMRLLKLLLKSKR